MPITGYCVVTEERNVILLNPVINKIGHRYMAVGHGYNGIKITTIVSKQKAEQEIANGTAIKGVGW